MTLVKKLHDFMLLKTFLAISFSIIKYIHWILKEHLILSSPWLPLLQVKEFFIQYFSGLVATSAHICINTEKNLIVNFIWGKNVTNKHIMITSLVGRNRFLNQWKINNADAYMPFKISNTQCSSKKLLSKSEEFVFPFSLIEAIWIFSPTSLD